jgi:hypothetical protein
MLMVACRLMTVGESGVSSAGFSVARSCFERCGWRFAGALDDELDAASAITRPAHVATRDVNCNTWRDFVIKTVPRRDTPWVAQT